MASKPEEADKNAQPNPTDRRALQKQRLAAKTFMDDEWNRDEYGKS